MMRNRLQILALAIAMTALSAHAQTTTPDKNLFNHLDFGVTAGTSGIGFDLAMPVTDWARVRTGFSYVPKVEVPMTFGIQVGDDPSTSSKKFNDLSTYLSHITGNQVKDEVEMTGRPTFWNWNVMVDVFPLKNNRHWHVTAGFFLGPSRVAEAYNKTESMASLMAVDIFNNMYDRVISSPVLNDEDYFYENNVIQVLNDIQLLHDLGVIKAKNFPAQLKDFYLDPDKNVIKTAYQDIAKYGRMGMGLGVYKRDITDEEGNIIHKKGERYIMEPDDNSMVRADMKVNAFKPYVGIGYDGRLTKHDDRLKIGFDAGVMFWGGTPSLTTHDGTDLINDVEGIGGKVGDYVDTIEKFKVFPLLNLRISYRLF